MITQQTTDLACLQSIQRFVVIAKIKDSTVNIDKTGQWPKPEAVALRLISAVPSGKYRVSPDIRTELWIVEDGQDDCHGGMS